MYWRVVYGQYDGDLYFPSPAFSDDITSDDISLWGNQARSRQNKIALRDDMIRDFKPYLYRFSYDGQRICCLISSVVVIRCQIDDTTFSRLQLPTANNALGCNARGVVI